MPPKGVCTMIKYFLVLTCFFNYVQEGPNIPELPGPVKGANGPSEIKQITKTGGNDEK